MAVRLACCPEERSLHRRQNFDLPYTPLFHDCVGPKQPLSHFALICIHALPGHSDSVSSWPATTWEGEASVSIATGECPGDHGFGICSTASPGVCQTAQQRDAVETVSLSQRVNLSILCFKQNGCCGLLFTSSWLSGRRNIPPEHQVFSGSETQLWLCNLHSGNRACRWRDSFRFSMSCLQGRNSSSSC